MDHLLLEERAGVEVCLGEHFVELISDRDGPFYLVQHRVLQACVLQRWLHQLGIGVSDVQPLKVDQVAIDDSLKGVQILKVALLQELVQPRVRGTDSSSDEAFKVDRS